MLFMFVHDVNWCTLLYSKLILNYFKDRLYYNSLHNSRLHGWSYLWYFTDHIVRARILGLKQLSLHYSLAWLKMSVLMCNVLVVKLLLVSRYIVFRFYCGHCRLWLKKFVVKTEECTGWFCWFKLVLFIAERKRLLLSLHWTFVPYWKWFLHGCCRGLLFHPNILSIIKMAC